MSELYKFKKGKFCNGVDKITVKKNFSRYARYYDKYSNIQNICASELILKIENNGFRNILDIGCGTGNYTRLLLEKFPKAKIKAIDISEEMIEIAKEKLAGKNIEFIVQDAESTDLEEGFDLVSSNAAFQWFSDLDSTLLKYKNALDKKGVILFSVFGPLTFYELNESLKESTKGAMRITSSNFVKKEQIAGMLKRFFKEITVEEKTYKEANYSLKELLKKIKYTGTRGNGIYSRPFWTPQAMDKLEKIYKEKFNLVSTSQVFFCKGIK